jgi:hypothetical protein
VFVVVLGYRVDNRSIEVTIKNQPFKSYTNSDGYECELYYNVQVKGHYGSDAEWRTFFYSSGLGFYGGDYRYDGFVQSDSGYTVVSSIIDYPVGSMLDFKVEAFTGYWVESTIGDHVVGMHSDKLVRDVSSAYSSIQTVTLTSGSLSLSPSQTTTLLPSVTFEDNQTQPPGQIQPPTAIYTHPIFLFGAGALFASVVIAVMLLLLRRHLKTPIYTQLNTS